MLKHHLGIVLQGMAVIVPVGVTIWIVWAVVAFVDHVMVALFGDPVFWVPGLGLVLALGIIYLVGLLTRWYLFRSAVDLAETIIGRVPLVKTLYGSVRDMLKFFGRGAGQQPTGRTVRVELAEQAHMLGITTTEDAGGDRVGVYLPLSYQIGGFLVYIERSRLRTLDMDVETALKLIMTGGLGVETDTTGDEDDTMASAVRAVEPTDQGGG